LGSGEICSVKPSQKMKKNTKIENQLLEMIQPRIQLIENKFSDGKALTDQDVNTLLLKSQFNHINHLDLRLDEVVGDVAQLRIDFIGLEGKFQALEARFLVLESRFQALEARIQALEARFEALEARFESLEAKIQATVEKTIRTNIRWTLGLITFSLTLIKIVELIVQK
jgi:predicted nuclease with TOPRIM domain